MLCVHIKPHPFHDVWCSDDIFCVFLIIVVVLGFEREAYVVFEGQPIEVCVAILNRTLTNDEDREFSVSTSQLTATSKS